MEKKGHSNHFNNRAHRKEKQHLDQPQTVNHMETPFHCHRSRDKSPSILPRPTTKWLDHLRLVNKVCKVRLHNQQTIPVRITNRISKKYFSSPDWSNMSTSISLHVRNKLYKQLSYMYKQNITKSKAYYLCSLIYVSPNEIQYKNKRFPNFVLPLLLAKYYVSCSKIP